MAHKRVGSGSSSIVAKTLESLASSNGNLQKINRMKNLMIEIQKYTINMTCHLHNAGKQVNTAVNSNDLNKASKAILYNFE